MVRLGTKFFQSYADWATGRRLSLGLYQFATTGKCYTVGNCKRDYWTHRSHWSWTGKCFESTWNYQDIAAPAAAAQCRPDGPTKTETTRRAAPGKDATTPCTTTFAASSARTTEKDTTSSSSCVYQTDSKSQQWSRSVSSSVLASAPGTNQSWTGTTSTAIFCWLTRSVSASSTTSRIGFSISFTTSASLVDTYQSFTAPTTCSLTLHSLVSCGKPVDPHQFVFYGTRSIWRRTHRE